MPVSEEQVCNARHLEYLKLSLTPVKHQLCILYFSPCRRVVCLLLGFHVPDERRPSHPVCASQETQLHPDQRPAPVRQGVRPVPGSSPERLLLRGSQSERRHLVPVPHPAAPPAARLRGPTDEERAKDRPSGVQAPHRHRGQPAGGGRGGKAGDPRPRSRGGEDSVPTGSSATREGDEREGDSCSALFISTSQPARSAVQASS